MADPFYPGSVTDALVIARRPSSSLLPTIRCRKSAGRMVPSVTVVKVERETVCMELALLEGRPQLIVKDAAELQKIQWPLHLFWFVLSFAVYVLVPVYI